MRTRIVAADACHAAVDDVDDAGDGDRGLGDVGGEDDPLSARCGTKDFLLILETEAGVESEDTGSGKLSAREEIGRLLNLSFSWQED